MHTRVKILIDLLIEYVKFVGINIISFSIHLTKQVYINYDLKVINLMQTVQKCQVKITRYTPPYFSQI